MADSGDDFNFRPPTEAEMKVREAQRERRDQISSLMGQYLLKGYKMLATNCSECDTILLRDRSNVDYCVACNELTSDTDKDNPALSSEAAASQVREQSTQSFHHQDSVRRDLGTASLSNVEPPGAAPVSAGLQSDLDCWPRRFERVSGRIDLTSPPVVRHEADLNAGPSQERRERTSRSNLALDNQTTLSNVRDVLQRKLNWASQKLDVCTDSAQALAYVKLIKCIMNTLKVFPDLS